MRVPSGSSSNSNKHYSNENNWVLIESLIWAVNRLVCLLTRYREKMHEKTQSESLHKNMLSTTWRNGTKIRWTKPIRPICRQKLPRVCSVAEMWRVVLYIPLRSRAAFQGGKPEFIGDHFVGVYLKNNGFLFSAKRLLLKWQKNGPVPIAPGAIST